MKKLFAILLCAVTVLCAASSCTLPEQAFISQNEKEAWRSDLVSVLSKIVIHQYEEGVPGSRAVGIMDIDFDNSPEVFVSYDGGSIGNVFFEIYDLKSGEKLCNYNAAHSGNGVCMYVAKKDGEYFTLTEGQMRELDIGWFRYISVLPKSINESANYLMGQALFAKADSEEIECYKYKGEVVDKETYEDNYKQFLSDYEKIGATEMELIPWKSLDAENKSEYFEKMADALISSTQKFIRS